ncbi:LysE family translocator [Shewanella sp. KX20019]|uniref:LysE family translocator n=1 Tax=Shewanella sp. KX20019 TaxID=2803864 RepID=UPI0019255335|nr:LysE family translocator [Shewanella sp. KX20019]QQX82036.1 LysE family translocator [Shewanella sp. KX20019]
MDLTLLVSLAVIHSVALASPGPDFALVVKMASQERRVTAIASAIGISIGILLHTLLSLTGVSLLIKSSGILFLIVQLAGASYLGWMGINIIISTLQNFKVRHIEKEKAQIFNQLTPSQGFTQGLYTNLLNPKAMVFFITLFSAMITPEVTLITKVWAAVTLLVLSLVWFVLIALVLSKPAIQQRIRTAAPVINLLTGMLFFSVALIIISGLF